MSNPTAKASELGSSHASLTDPGASVVTPTSVSLPTHASALPASARSESATRSIAACLGLAIFLSMLPVTMMVPVLKELVGDRFAAGSFWVHSFMSINMIGAVVFAPFGGALADRLGRRKPIIVVAALVDAALLALMSKLTTLSTLLLVRFLEGGAHILVVTTIMAMASDWADPKRRGAMMGLVGAALIFGTSCGAPLGGRIGQHAPLWVFTIGAIFSLVVALLAAVALRESPSRSKSKRFSDALAMVKHNRRLLVPYAYAFIDRFCVGVIVSTFVLYLSEMHGLSPSGRGGLLALFLFPFAFMCYPMGKLSDRIGRVLPLCLGSLGFGFVYASYGLIPLSMLPIAMILSGLLSAIMFSPNLALCTDLAPKDQRASVYAGFNVAGSLGFVAGPLLGGTICALFANSEGSALPYQVAFIAAGLTEVLCAALTLPYLLKLRRTGYIT